MNDAWQPHPGRLHLENIAASLQTVEMQQWYEHHKKRGDHPLKLAAEIYVSILGYPQLYIEGNHRTGSLIANWISVYHGFPPFVLSVDNAIAYFAPFTQWIVPSRICLRVCYSSNRISV